MPRRTIIAIDPPFVWRILVGISVILIALDVSLQTLDWIAEPGVPGWDTIAIILDADGESSVPTWWGSLLLTTAAITSALVAHAGRHIDPRDHLYFWAFAATFIMLSIDEQAMIHEHAIVPLRERFGFSGPLFFAWIVPATIGVVILIAVCVRFVFRQPSRARRLLILAAGLYLSGALILEMVGGW